MGPREERTLRGTTSQAGAKKRKVASSTPMTILEVRRLKVPVKEAQEDQMSKSLGAKIVKKKRRCAERRNVVASFTVEDIPPGKRAQQGQLTKLEKKSISCEQENQYTHYLSKFKAFCQESGLRWPPRAKVDLLLAEFDVLFQEGNGVRPGEKTLAAVEYQWRHVKGTMLRSRRALKGWRKMVPPKSRLPLPRAVAFGIAMRMLSLQQRSMALLVLLSFDMYLRPGEGLTLKVKNVVPPFQGSGRQYQRYVVVVRDEEDNVPDKTGVFNNSLPLDNPSTAGWLGKALDNLKKGKKQDDALFSVEADKYRKAFESAGGWLGLPGAAKNREYAAVKDRGRWRTDTSVRRYGKVGKIQTLLNKLPKWALDYCRRSEMTMGAVPSGSKNPLSLQLHSGKTGGKRFLPAAVDSPQRSKS